MMSQAPPNFFEYDACFRIAGLGTFHSEITMRTGLKASKKHLIGDLRYPNAKPAKPNDVYHEDIWIIESPLPPSVSHEEHLNWLWAQISPHKDYFKIIIEKATWADVMLGCFTSSVMPILKVDQSALTILRELSVSLSFNFTVS